MLPPEDQKLAWKGAIIPDMLSTDQIKNFVLEILKKLKFRPDVTLK